MYRFEEFLNHVSRRNYRPTTIAKYVYTLSLLGEFLQTHGISDDRQVAREHVLAFLKRHLPPEGPSVYYGSLIARVRLYFSYLQESGVIFTSPAAGIRCGKAPLHHFPVILPDRFIPMLDRITGNDAVSVRGRAILELAYSSALRPREIRDLKLAQVNHRSRTLLIERSKGDKDRVVPVGRKALDWVQRYVVKVRPRYVRRADQDCVFLSHRTGEDLTVRGLWWAIREALRRNGLPPLKPYSIRGSAATALHAGGADVSYISRILGHERLTTTAGYLRITDPELGDRIAGGHPRAAWGYVRGEANQEVHA